MGNALISKGPTSTTNHGSGPFFVNQQAAHDHRSSNRRHRDKEKKDKASTGGSSKISTKSGKVTVTQVKPIQINTSTGAHMKGSHHQTSHRRRINDSNPENIIEV